MGGEEGERGKLKEREENGRLERRGEGRLGAEESMYVKGKGND